MKKLRLLVTEKCTRNCEGCCNKDLKPKGVLTSIQNWEEYYQIMITGGEPLLYPNELLAFLTKLSRKYFQILYTAITLQDKRKMKEIFCLLDGVTFTIHDKRGIRDFIRLNKFLQRNSFGLHQRLNIFCDVQLPPINLYGWDVKFIEWIKNCPLPENEDFYKLDKLWQ